MAQVARTQCSHCNSTTGVSLVLPNGGNSILPTCSSCEPHSMKVPACTRHEVAASFFCRTCAAFICNSCILDHNRSLGHRIQNVESFRLACGEALDSRSAALSHLEEQRVAHLTRLHSQSQQLAAQRSEFSEQSSVLWRRVFTALDLARKRSDAWKHALRQQYDDVHGDIKRYSAEVERLSEIRHKCETSPLGLTMSTLTAADAVLFELSCTMKQQPQLHLSLDADAIKNVTLLLSKLELVRASYTSEAAIEPEELQLPSLEDLLGDSRDSPPPNYDDVHTTDENTAEDVMAEVDESIPAEGNLAADVLTKLSNSLPEDLEKPTQGVKVQRSRSTGQVSRRLTERLHVVSKAGVLQIADMSQPQKPWRVAPARDNSGDRERRPIGLAPQTVKAPVLNGVDPYELIRRLRKLPGARIPVPEVVAVVPGGHYVVDLDKVAEVEGEKRFSLTRLLSGGRQRGGGRKKQRSEGETGSPGSRDSLPRQAPGSVSRSHTFARRDSTPPLPPMSASELRLQQQLGQPKEELGTSPLIRPPLRPTTLPLRERIRTQQVDSMENSRNGIPHHHEGGNTIKSEIVYQEKAQRQQAAPRYDTQSFNTMPADSSRGRSPSHENSINGRRESLAPSDTLLPDALLQSILKTQSVFTAPTGNITGAPVGQAPNAVKTDEREVHRFGTRGKLPGMFNWPEALIVAGDLLYVADFLNQRIQVFDLDGNLEFIFELPLGCFPGQMALDPSEQLLVIPLLQREGSGYVCSCLDVYTLAGEPHSRINCPEAICARSVAVFEDLVVVADQTRHCLLFYSWTGTLIRSVGGQGSGPGQFNHPCFVTRVADRLLYVADQNNHRIQVVDKDGVVYAPLPRRFNRPASVAVNHGDVFVADGTNCVQYLHGDKVDRFSHLRGPRGLATARGGYLFVSDVGNFCVKKYKYT